MKAGSINYSLSFGLLLLLATESCKKESQPDTCADGIMNNDETAVDCGGYCSPCMLTARDSILKDYRDNYLPTQMTQVESGWDGNTANCFPGGLPPVTIDKVLRRVNYFRRLVGLNSDLTWDTTHFAKCQEAALMMHANGALNHNPPNTWACFTPGGALAASKSNLSIGSSPSGSVTSCMQDNGSGNVDVGHRRWLLHSTKKQFSFGATSNAAVMYVIGTQAGNTQIPPFIAYPSKGFFPRPLAFARWSFGIPQAIFDNATVSMTDSQGNDINLTVISKSKTGYGDNTIVWEPQGIDPLATNDAEYSVTVSGIANATQTTYTYKVVLVNP